MFSLTTTPCLSLWPLLSRLLATRRDLDAHEGRNKQKNLLNQAVVTVTWTAGR